MLPKKLLTDHSAISVQEHAKLTWGDDELPCISLSMPGVSAMHKLRQVANAELATHFLSCVLFFLLLKWYYFENRPQPSWDRTCTAAAAIGLLAELHTVPSFSTFGLENQAEAVENGLDVLLDALTARRLRMGRSITRRERRSNHIPNSQGSL